MTDTTEHDLPGTRRAFQDAIHTLIGRTRTTITRDDGTTEPAWGASLYEQIRDHVSGAQGSGGSSHAGSRPPIVADALDLTTQIDRHVIAWVGAGTAPDTVGRLTALEEHQWRPQDVPWLKDRTADLIWWAARARSILDPEPRWTVTAPCPECDTSTVYRQDSAGETVRQPALKIADGGCICQQCRTYWPPEHFPLLAAAIGIITKDVSA